MEPASTSTAVTRPRGRPTLYTPELADDICRRMAEGESLNAICQPDDMPAESTVRGWAVDDRGGFYAKYMRAWQVRALGYPDDIERIADESGFDVTLDDKGNYTINGDTVQRAKLRIDARKWIGSKFLPKLMGDKVTVDGEVGLYPLLQRIPADEAARLLALPDDELREAIAELSS